jgi:protein SCO1/2
MTKATFAVAAALLLSLPATAAPSDRVEKQRRYFGNPALVTQDGREVRLFDEVLLDRVVLIDFVFTRCTGACPLLTQKLVEVRRELGAAFGNGVRFVSVSVDPLHDGPAQLRAFAEKHGAAVPGWTFLTGNKADVDGVVKKLGQYVEAPEDHSTVFIVGNTRTGHWARLRPDAPAAILAEQLRTLLAEKPAGAPVATNG